MEDFLKWWPVGLFVFQFLLAWVLWSLVKRFVTREDFETYRVAHQDEHEAIDTRMAEGKAQFARIESELRHLPTRKDIDDLKAQLASVDKGVVKLDGSIRVVAAKLGAVEKPVDILMEHHLDGDRG
jgi:hypothetical protein